jgi:hypothetical protein
MKIHNIKTATNSVFGLSILTVTTYLLVAIISFLYMALAELLKNDSAKDLSTLIHNISNHFIWFCAFSLLLLAISLTCERAGKEAYDTSVCIQKCLLADNLGAEVSAELQLFSQQVSSYKLVFSACGVLEINTSLLLSVTATVATYIIVLLSVR